MAAAFATAIRQSSIGPSITASNIAGRVDLIRASPLFIGLSQPVYERIAWLARPKAFARDKIIFMQGEPAHSVVLIRSGSVKVTQLAPNGNEVILWMYGAGNVLGGLSEPTSCCYTCSASALEQSTALVWEFAAIQSLMLEYSQIRKNASLILATRLNELEERFREVATERVPKRVALALLRLLKHIGKDVHGGVEVSLSREELAQMTGTTLFTISRLISKWGELGFILPRREALIVSDVHRLEMAQDDDLEEETRVMRGKCDTSHRKPAHLRVFGSTLANHGPRKISVATC
jgi:CRP-like cAMP-binding protein